MTCSCAWASESHDGFSADSASAEDLEAIATGYKVTLPDDYVAFMQVHDGAEITGDDITIEVFAAAELAADVTMFKRLQRDGKSPHLHVFGSNNDGELLVFDYRSDPPLVSMTPVASFGYDDCFPVAVSFDALIRRHGHLGPL